VTDLDLGSSRCGLERFPEAKLTGYRQRTILAAPLRKVFQVSEQVAERPTAGIEMVVTPWGTA